MTHPNNAESAPPECGHWFHASTGYGFCPRCGGSWKRRHPPKPKVTRSDGYPAGSDG